MFDIKNNHFHVLCNTQDDLDTVVACLHKLGLKEKSWSDVGIPCIVGRYDLSEKDMRYSDYSTSLQKGEMLSISELQDLAVLASNNINDATHKDGAVNYYITSDDKLYYFDSLHSNAWHTSRFTVNKIISNPSVIDLRDDKGGENSTAKPIGSICEGHFSPKLVPTAKITIDSKCDGVDVIRNILSPKEALLALADGDVLQYSDEEDVWVDMDMSTHFKRKFRRKPKPKIETIKVEMPKPFTPSVGEKYYYIDSDRDQGYSWNTYSDDKHDKHYMQFGAWRTQEEVEMVVKALREVMANAE